MVYIHVHVCNDLQETKDNLYCAIFKEGYFIIFPVGVKRSKNLHWYLILLFQFTAQCYPDVFLSLWNLLALRYVYDNE